MQTVVWIFSQHCYRSLGLVYKFMEFANFFDFLFHGQITGAPKLINSNLFLKSATVPVPILDVECSTFSHKQFTINQFWGACGQIL